MLLKQIKTRIKKKFFVKPLPPVFKPSKVDGKDIRSNGFLLRDHEIEHAKGYFTKNSKKMRLPKFKSKLPFTVIRFEGDKNKDLYAIYSGKNNKELGKGGFGKVKLMQNLRTHEWFAVKVQAIPKLDSHEESQYKNFLKDEKFFLDEAGQFIGSLYRKREEKNNKKEEKQFILAMKLAPGVSLGDYIFDHIHELDPSKRLSMAISILEAVKKLHDRSILHCDLKPENLLYDPINNITTPIDFGFASKLGEGKHGIFLDTVKGTRGYMAPEIKEAHEIEYVPYYSKKSDLYALGQTLRWLVDDSLIQKTGNNDLYKEDQTIKAVLKYIKTSMCHKDDLMRPNIEQSINYFKTLLYQNLPTHLFNTIDVEPINNDKVLSSRSHLKEKDHKKADGVIFINQRPNKIHNNFFKRIFLKLENNKKNTQMISVYETNNTNPTEAAINFHQKNNDANNIPLYVTENKTSRPLNNEISSKERNTLEQGFDETVKATAKKYKNNKEDKNVILNFIKKIILSTEKESDKTKIHEALIFGQRQLNELRHRRPAPPIPNKKAAQKESKKRFGGLKNIPKNIKLFFDKKAQYDQQHKINNNNKTANNNNPPKKTR